MLTQSSVAVGLLAIVVFGADSRVQQETLGTAPSGLSVIAPQSVPPFHVRQSASLFPWWRPLFDTKPAVPAASCAAAPSNTDPSQFFTYSGGTRTFSADITSFDCTYRHQFQIDDIDNGYANVESGEVTSYFPVYTTTTSLPTGRYRWRFRSANTDLVYGPWGEYWALIVQPGTPSVSGSISGNFSHLSWSAIPRASVYDIYRECIDVDGG